MTEAPYIPLLVDFTHEDKAAKGLRSLRDPAAASAPAAYFSAAEIVEAGGPVLLLGERGSGKTEFARRLAEDNRYHYAGISRPAALDALVEGIAPEQIPVLDGIDRLEGDGPVLIAEALLRYPEHLVVLGETSIVRSWPIPSGYRVHSLLPLSVEQRTTALTAAGLPTGAALSVPAANPALFALSIGLPVPVATAEELIDQWLETQPPGDYVRAAFAALRDGASLNRVIEGLLAVRHLQAMPLTTVAGLFAAAPQLWTQTVASLARRLENPESLIDELVALPDDIGLRGALLSAGMLAPGSVSFPAVCAALLRIVELGRLSPAERDQAARTLAQIGDPRNLEALEDVPGGTFILGSTTHPNSAPPHPVTVASFRIGRFPVTNGQYRRFIEATGRGWVSPGGRLPERANAPATDLTWHDARAYCDWLTGVWRAEGRIGAGEQVRLPTEPEWERAARGDQADPGDAIVYPWGGPWDADAANAEQTGFNGTCAVGLFSKGRSPYGCFDMAGQVWEWTTTLWGSDMVTPSYAYPYRDDGRENLDTPADIRRVLRGGCFSSASFKACCTYRGSLEPSGHWRGNGFRIVVAGLG